MACPTAFALPPRRSSTWLALDAASRSTSSRSPTSSSVASADALARAYDLIVFAGPPRVRHRRASTTSSRASATAVATSCSCPRTTSSGESTVEDDVDRRRPSRWRDLGRPEAALVGVQYVGESARRRVGRGSSARRRRARGSSPERACVSGRRSRAAASRSTRSRPARRAASRSLAEIPNLFGPGMTAQMTYYETPCRRTRVRRGCVPPHPAVDVGLRSSWRMLENLWARTGDAMTSTAASVAGAVAVGCSPSPARRAPALPPALVCKLPRDSNRAASADRAARPDRPSAPVPGDLGSRHARSARAPGASSTRLVDAPRPRQLAERARPPSAPGTTRASRPRKSGDRSVFFFHAERRRGAARADRSSTSRGRRRSSTRTRPAGRSSSSARCGARATARSGRRRPAPILRWHSHVVCKEGKKRGLKPLAGGRCPPGARLTQGASEMLHVWFTGDLRSAFAITRPKPELCSAGLLPPRLLRALVAGSSITSQPK